MAGVAKPSRSAVGVGRALALAGAAWLLAVGAFPALAAREPLSRLPEVSPVSSGLTVIPHGQREVRVTWTLRASRPGARVVLYAGATLDSGRPLLEVSAVPGLHSYEYVDRSGRDGRWLYWLVVVDGNAHSAVLGTLVCVSPSMDEGPAQAPPQARPALAEWPETEPPVRRWAPPGVPVSPGDALLDAPPAPPPERA
ncbi:hypothetical protein FBQ97_04445 [Acidobacteria bacterium ACD]|nr:MAG: hypothetical protein EDX89_00455 [Acidobacteriota bacterium]MDL1949048.1 hypothetical protein [Acidobacteria bacterium ACD]